MAQTESGRRAATHNVPPEIRERVSGLRERIGTAKAAKFLGVSRWVVLAVSAGEPVMPGTVALLEKALKL